MAFFLGLAFFETAVAIFVKLADIAESPSLAVVGIIPHLGPQVEGIPRPQRQTHAS